MTPPVSHSGLRSPDRQPLRVCYFGTYRAGYARNRLMIEGLRRNGVKVIECHEPLWRGVDDRVQAVQGTWKTPLFWRRVVRTYVRLIRRYLSQHQDYDVMIVGYPGQFDLPLARLLSWIRRRPLVWDILMSIYLVAVERSLQERSPGVVNLLRLVEQAAVQLPDLLIMDTEQYATWFGHTYGVARRRFRLVPIGADNTAFEPALNECRNDSPTRASDEFRVLYYGTFIENHGVSYIVEAARLLSSHRDISFELVGDGPERPRAAEMVRSYGLCNVDLVGWLDQDALRDRIAHADLCLGVFGLTSQSMMTVHNKIKESMAMAKPVLTGDSPAVRDAFEHARDLYLCPRADPLALAAAIVELQQYDELRKCMARTGRSTVIRDYTIEKNGERFVAILQEIMSRKTRHAGRAR